MTVSRSFEACAAETSVWNWLDDRNRNKNRYRLADTMVAMAFVLRTAFRLAVAVELSCGLVNQSYMSSTMS